MFPALDRWGNVRDASKAMQPRAVADVIRKRAAAIGLRATGHNLRVGAAVSMASRGASARALRISPAAARHADRFPGPGGRKDAEVSPSAGDRLGAAKKLLLPDPKRRLFRPQNHPEMPSRLPCRLREVPQPPTLTLNPEVHE